MGPYGHEHPRGCHGAVVELGLLLYFILVVQISEVTSYVSGTDCSAGTPIAPSINATRELGRIPGRCAKHRHCGRLAMVYGSHAVHLVRIGIHGAHDRDHGIRR